MNGDRSNLRLVGDDGDADAIIRQLRGELETAQRDLRLWQRQAQRYREGALLATSNALLWRRFAKRALADKLTPVTLSFIAGIAFHILLQSAIIR